MNRLPFKIVFLGLVVVLGWAVGTAMAVEGWVTDFAKAKETAVKEKKDLLVNFTGSDWCPHCIKLRDNVFTQKGFLDTIPYKFVLVTLDFPKDDSKQSEAEKTQNQQLQEQYSVSGFPTIFMMDAQGKPFGMNVGYSNETAEEYAKNLLDQQANRVKRDELMAKAGKAKGEEKAKLIDEALSLLDEEIVMTYYQDQFPAIIEADKDNKAGLKEKYEGILRAEELAEKINAILVPTQGDGEKMKEAIPKISALMTDKSSNAEKFQVLYYRSILKYQTKDTTGAKADLEACLKVATDDEKSEQIKTILTRFFADAE